MEDSPAPLLSQRAVTAIAYGLMIFGVVSYFRPTEGPSGFEIAPGRWADRLSAIAMLAGMGLWVLAEAAPRLRQRLFTPRSPLPQTPIELFEAPLWILVFFGLMIGMSLAAGAVASALQDDMKVVALFGCDGFGRLLFLLILAMAMKRRGLVFDRVFGITLSRGDLGAAPLAFLLETPLALAGVYASQLLLSHFGKTIALQEVGQKVYNAGWWGSLAAVVVIVGIVPVVEEVLFRGILYRALRGHYGVGFSVVVSAVFFSMAHMQPEYFLALLTIGAALAITYERTGRLTTCVALHGAINLTAVVMIFLSKMKT